MSIVLVGLAVGDRGGAAAVDAITPIVIRHAAAHGGVVTHEDSIHRVPGGTAIFDHGLRARAAGDAALGVRVGHAAEHQTARSSADAARIVVIAGRAVAHSAASAGQDAG